MRSRDESLLGVIFWAGGTKRHRWLHDSLARGICKIDRLSHSQRTSKESQLELEELTICDRRGRHAIGPRSNQRPQG